ncbi:MAG: DUF2235 domain-containing protein, partial [Caballeronia sp.]
ATSGPDAPPNAARPGETGYDIGTNDKTDLRQGAEQMRLLLGYLYPEQQRDVWHVQATAQSDPYANSYPPPPPLPPELSVQHEGIRDDPPKSASPKVRLVNGTTLHALRTAIGRSYNVADDVVLMPVKEAKPFLQQHASREAGGQLPDAAVKLFDDYVHDSRCWFRVPYFLEYAPGGYFWPRIVFIGKDQRTPLLGFDPLLVALDTDVAQETAMT